MNPNIKPDNLSLAESVLLDAGQAIRDRSKEHGHTERSFGMIGDLWTNYITHAFTIRGETKLYPHDIAHMMSLIKVARAVYGYSVDNFVDGVGYTALAAMLTPPQDNGREMSSKTMAELYPKDDHNKTYSEVPSNVDGKR
jgi:hypothetical protein